MMLDESTFQIAIEEMVERMGITHLEALVNFCSENDLDGEDVKGIISPNLKDKIYANAQDEGHYKKTARLPI
jgi:pyoverdine/dityrosine biosynthesis protein Dit1